MSAGTLRRPPFFGEWFLISWDSLTLPNYDAIGIPFGGAGDTRRVGKVVGDLHVSRAGHNLNELRIEIQCAKLRTGGRRGLHSWQYGLDWPGPSVCVCLLIFVYWYTQKFLFIFPLVQIKVQIRNGTRHQFGRREKFQFRRSASVCVRLEKSKQHLHHMKNRPRTGSTFAALDSARENSFSMSGTKVHLDTGSSKHLLRIVPE